ncbi:hypothetical protein A6R68_00395 [Neotoma lepida]|uniref:Uncharacterized protein n=1 Tax=Neotoma lepida TaxID=56216 RepID=A0A1A6GY25_NEOLE|nr:hypothetical protein A6R68_00395 [Neotoma lepida]
MKQTPDVVTSQMGHATETTQAQFQTNPSIYNAGLVLPLPQAQPDKESSGRILKDKPQSSSSREESQPCRGACEPDKKDSSFTADMSPFGVEEREEPLSVLSDPELLWFCCSDPALEVTVEEDVDEDRVFSLKSVIMTGATKRQKKQKNIKHSRNITSDETVNTAQLENFLELLRRSWVLHSLMGYNVDGHHSHDISSANTNKPKDASVK